MDFSQGKSLVSSVLNSRMTFFKIKTVVGFQFMHDTLLEEKKTYRINIFVSTFLLQVVLVYNSLGWKREDVIRIPVCNLYSLENKKDTML